MLLFLAIVAAVLGVAIFFLGQFATMMSTTGDVPSGCTPYAIGVLLVAAMLFGLWWGGFHLTPLITRS